MTEEQAEKIIELLKDIEARLTELEYDIDEIKRNMS